MDTNDALLSARDVSLAGRPFGVRPLMAALPASKIVEVAADAFDDPGVLPLWYGESDQPTAAFICEAASEALRQGHTFYTFKRGIPALRLALSEYLSRLHARSVATERVVVTSAGMNAIMLTCQMVVAPGDNVVVLAPVWPNITGAVEAQGGEPRLVPLDATEDGGWRLDLDRLMAACDGRTVAIFINSPGNPTGWMMRQDEAASLLAFARSRRLWIVSDEVYERIVYDRRVAPSMLDLAEPEDRVIVINSFSKAWSMTGWRLGWMVVPEILLPILDKLIEINTSGAPTFLQHAAVTAIRDGEGVVAELVERCRLGRDVVLQGLSRFSRVRVAAPEGAFYAFFRVDGVTDSLAFAKEVLRRCKVGLAPGSAFGPHGEGYLRLCFASSASRLGEALDRLRPMLG